MFKTIATLCLLVLASVLSAQQPLEIASPDGSIRFSLRVTPSAPLYSVTYKGRKLISDAKLGFTFKEGGEFAKGLTATDILFRDSMEVYRLVVGKTAEVNEKYRELSLILAEKAGVKRRVAFFVRLFNDGVAFRYEFPGQQNLTSLAIMEEHSTFRFEGNPKLLALFLPNYTSSQEGLYTALQLNQVKPDTLMAMPVLAQLPGNLFVGITEAALSDYAGMYLSRKNGVLSSTLSPLPGQTAVKVNCKLPHRTPWRVLMISDRMGALIESNILTNLCPPNRITDVAWLRPGKTTFPWWNGTIIPDTLRNPGNNFETNKYYIDFCARNGIEYHSVVEYGGHEWYTNDGEGYQPGANVDVTRPVPGLDMKQVCDYAKSRGVGVRVWVHWKALYPKLDEAFALFEQWGLSGMMVDFMDRDDQEMVNIQEEILQKAAKHKLHIQFHGAYKPTGMHRTYPNEFTREGTLNYEVNKWDTIVNPDHDINIPFTRMLAGSTDYHLGGFRSAPAGQFKVQFLKPLQQGTRCHMLAMYVVLENYQGMVCDFPEAYEGQPGFNFLQQVPVTWDETKVLDAVPQQYIIIARRKGPDWYIGAITNSAARKITVPLDFLPDGTHKATIYSDAADAATRPDNLERKSLEVSNKAVLPIQLAPGGGAAIRITL